MQAPMLSFTGPRKEKKMLSQKFRVLLQVECMGNILQNVLDGLKMKCKTKLSIFCPQTESHGAHLPYPCLPP